MTDGKITIATELETKSFDAQIKKLESKLETMTKTLETEAEIPVHLRMSEDERLALENDIEKTKNQIISLQEKMADDEPSNKMSNNFKKSAKNMRRFALSLISVGSVFALVSKASSTYLSQDTELAEKLKNVWVGLGSFLAPVIEYISDLLLKGLGYLNEFIKALTGVDFIARANAKALEKQAKAQKKLNVETYDFDVIRKQSGALSTNSSNSSGLITIPELDQNVISKLQKMATVLKDNWYWIKEVGIILGVTFGAVKIAQLLKNISAIIGVGGAGLTGLLTALMAVATIWIVSVAVKGITEAINQVKQLQTLLNGLRNTATTNTEKEIANEKEIYQGIQSGQIKEGISNYYETILSNQIDALKNMNKTSAIPYSKALVQSLIDYYSLINTGKYNATEQELQTLANLKKEANSVLNNLTIGGTANILNDIYSGLSGKSLSGLTTQPKFNSATTGVLGYTNTPTNAVSTFSNLPTQNTTNVYLDGRLIQRQVSNTQNQVNFATNN